jgi:hypothetical protein
MGEVVGQKRSSRLDEGSSRAEEEWLVGRGEQ